MVILKMLNYGMANQLFAYTFGRYLCNKYNEELAVYYPNKMQHSASFSKCLKNYKLRIDKIITYREMVKLSHGKNLLYSFLLLYYKVIYNPVNTHIFIENKIGKRLSELGVIANYDVDHTDEYFKKKFKKDIIAFGYFQIPFFAEEIRSELLNEIVISQERMITHKKIIDCIKECNSVCMHIRRGDYLKNKKHFVCDDTYYIKAVKEISSYISDPVFFVFSDDIEYVKKNIKIPSNRIVYASDGDIPDYEELYLMKLCRHFIISNSSYSWWAQFLCENPDKIVVAPEHWYADKRITGKLYAETWKKI